MRMVIFAACLSIATQAVAGDVYRCTDASGRVEYRDSPCARDMSGQKIRLEPLNVIQGIDQSVMRAAAAALEARAAARIASEEAETAARRATWEAQRAAQEQAARQNVPEYGWATWEYPAFAPPPERPKPQPPVAIPPSQPPPAVPASVGSRRF